MRYQRIYDAIAARARAAGLAGLPATVMLFVTRRLRLGTALAVGSILFKNVSQRMLATRFTSSRRRLGTLDTGLDVLSRRAGPRDTTNESRHEHHTLLDLRQQIHPGIPPQRLQIHDDGAGPPAVQ